MAAGLDVFGPGLARRTGLRGGFDGLNAPGFGLLAVQFARGGALVHEHAQAVCPAPGPPQSTMSAHRQSCGG